MLDEYGSHALTLDHVGAYLAEFCDGDPASAGRVEEPRLDSNTREERRLARVLHAYERALSSREVDLLARFCIFRSGASIETLHSIFARTDAPTSAGPLRGAARTSSGGLSRGSPGCTCCSQIQPAATPPIRPSATTSTGPSRTPRRRTASSARS